MKSRDKYEGNNRTSETDRGREKKDIIYQMRETFKDDQFLL